MDIKDLFCNDTKFYVKKKKVKGVLLQQYKTSPFAFMYYNKPIEENLY